MRQRWIVTVAQTKSRYICDACSKRGQHSEVTGFEVFSIDKPTAIIRDNVLMFTTPTATYGWPLATVCCWTVRRARDTQRSP